MSLSYDKVTADKLKSVIVNETLDMENPVFGRYSKYQRFLFSHLFTNILSKLASHGSLRYQVNIDAISPAYNMTSFPPDVWI